VNRNAASEQRVRGLRRYALACAVAVFAQSLALADARPWGVFELLHSPLEARAAMVTSRAQSLNLAGRQAQADLVKATDDYNSALKDHQQLQARLQAQQAQQALQAQQAQQAQQAAQQQQYQQTQQYQQYQQTPQYQSAPAPAVTEIPSQPVTHTASS